MSTEKSKPSFTHPDGEPAPIVKGSHVYLIDGSGYIFRAFHALPPLTRPSDGLPVGAVHGFCAMLWKLLRETKMSEAPTHLAVIFDAGRETFRNKIYTEYKAHRPPPPDELIPQFALIRDAVKAFSVACIEQDGYEADDLIATYARDVVNLGGDVTIVSSDKDLMQLIRPGVVMLDTMKSKRIGRDEVIEKFGVPPEKVVDVQSLAGDSVDNVPGVPGIGLKSASAIIREVGDLDRVLATSPDDVEEQFFDLRNRLGSLQGELDEIAGEPVKLGSGVQIAKVLLGKCGVLEHQLKQDKKGVWTADSSTVEQLAANGNEYCQKILRARDLNKTLSSHIGHILQFADQARISRELVRLKDDVPVEVGVDRTVVHEPDPATLLGFLRAMEFNTLTKRVSEGLGVDAPAPLAVSVGSSLHLPQAPGKSGEGDKGAGTPSAAVAYHSAGVLNNPIQRSLYEVVETAAQLASWIGAAHTAGHVAIDIITERPDDATAAIAGIALATQDGKACYVAIGHSDGASDLFGGGGVVPGQIPLREVLAQLQPLFADEAVLKIGHNIKFDILVLARHGFTVAAVDDVMLMSYALDGGRGGHGLDDLAERHLKYTVLSLDKALEHAPGAKKANRVIAGLPLAKATEYAAEKTDVILRLWRVLKPRLVAEKVVSVYETLERPLLPVLAQMELAGIKIDRPVLSRLSGTFAQRAGALEEEINTLAGEKFNLGSPKQLGELLFDRLKLPGGKRTKSGQWETRAGALDDLANNEELPDDARRLVNIMLQWRQLNKLQSTYTDALPEYIEAATGRIHTSYALASTTTGRLASTEPNVQNIPIRTKEGREIRTAFIAEAGHKLISADYSQIELRVLADIADIPQLKMAFSEGLDIHAMTASEMFGVPVKDMPADVRRRAKAINFGIIYGISAFGLANQLGISREEAGLYIKTYFERFPGIRDYMEATKKSARALGYVTTIFGRRIHYPEINTKNPSVRGNLERAAINAPIQGSAADIIRRAMIRMPAALAAANLNSARMLLQVHDELVFEVNDADVDATIKTVRRVMERAAEPAVKLSVPIHVDAKAAKNWEEAH